MSKLDEWIARIGPEAANARQARRFWALLNALSLFAYALIGVLVLARAFPTYQAQLAFCGILGGTATLVLIVGMFRFELSNRKMLRKAAIAIYRASSGRIKVVPGTVLGNIGRFDEWAKVNSIPRLDN